MNQKLVCWRGTLFMRVVESSRRRREFIRWRGEPAKADAINGYCLSRWRGNQTDCSFSPHIQICLSRWRGNLFIPIPGMRFLMKLSYPLAREPPPSIHLLSNCRAIPLARGTLH